MTRRRLFLLSGFLTACAISLGVIVPPYLPSPVQAEIDELRGLLDPVAGDAVADDLESDSSDTILLRVIVIAFNVTKSRTTLFASEDCTVRGTVKDHRLLEWAQRVSARGYARILAEPSLTVANGQQATFLSGGQTPVLPHDGQIVRYIPIGIVMGCETTIRKDGRFLLKMEATQSALKKPAAYVNGVPQMDIWQATGSFVLHEEQSCFAVIPKRKTTQQTDYIPCLSDLPGVGAWLRWPREVEVEEELLVVVTPRRVRPL